LPTALSPRHMIFNASLISFLGGFFAILWLLIAKVAVVWLQKNYIYMNLMHKSGFGSRNILQQSSCLHTNY